MATPLDMELHILNALRVDRIVENLRKEDKPKPEDGGGAFPTRYSDSTYRGMSLLQWYAGLVLQGIWSNTESCADYSASEIAEICFKQAQAMIAEEKRLRE